MSSSIESLLKESRVFPPPAAFAATAHVATLEQYHALHAESLDQPERFWLARAKELHWFKAPERALVHTPPHATWFAGGTTNLSYNCLDRHLDGPRKNQAALVWEGEPQRGPEDSRTLTYGDLHLAVSRFANALRGLGVEKGDRVAIYMGMVPEIVVAMLACARIGAVHTVIFGGFAPDAIRDRVNDAGAKVIVTCDGAFRRGQPLHLKPIVDAAVVHCPSVKHVVVFRRLHGDCAMTPGRDHDWQALVAGSSPHCEAEPLDAEHPLFILYTSGTTGKPKGVVHTTGGYMVQASLTSRLVFDLKDGDTYFCTADVGWVTGHSYVAYGPLCNGATVLMYEGAPNFPAPDRLWDICERHRVSIFYTAPTAIRAFMRWGDEHVKKHDLSSLRLLGTVGEPINPEAWMWYHRTVGGGRCPIVDTWWQTETGAIMISPLPGAIPTVPGSATLPFFGIDADVVRKDGTPCAPNEGGYLVIKRPWPSMLRTIFGDDERYQRQYFSDIPGVYFTGDGARKDERGYFWIMGRVDDVVNVSGHRLGTAEIESALVSHPAVAEAAVVGRPDDVKGQALVAFVSLRPGNAAGETLVKALIEHVGNEIGKFARPDSIRFTDALPKTRSGKIMRRLLKELASGGEVKGDVTTLEDINVLKALAKEDE